MGRWVHTICVPLALAALRGCQPNHVQGCHNHVHARLCWLGPRAVFCTALCGPEHNYLCGHLWGWLLARGLPWTSMGGCRRVHVSTRVVLNTRVRDEAPWEPRFRRSLLFVAVPFQTKDCQMEGARGVHPRCLMCIQAVSLMCIQAVCWRSAGVLARGCNDLSSWSGHLVYEGAKHPTTYTPCGACRGMYVVECIKFLPPLPECCSFSAGCGGVLAGWFLDACIFDLVSRKAP